MLLLHSCLFSIIDLNLSSMSASYFGTHLYLLTWALMGTTVDIKCHWLSRVSYFLAWDSFPPPNNMFVGGLALWLEEAFCQSSKIYIVLKISLHAIDEIQKNFKDGRDDAVSKPRMAPCKGESLSRAPRAAVMGRAYRAAAFFWVGREQKVTKISSSWRLFRKGFAFCSITSRLKQGIHRFQWDVQTAILLRCLGRSPWSPQDT